MGESLHRRQDGNLLKYQTDPLPTGLAVDFPVDDWLYGVARVRNKLHHWERIVMLSGAFSRSEPELVPIQLPYRDDDRWLAPEYPTIPTSLSIVIACCTRSLSAGLFQSVCPMWDPLG